MPKARCLTAPFTFANIESNYPIYRNSFVISWDLGGSPMHIAIIDDLSFDGEALCASLEQWAREKQILLLPPPVLFESGEAFLSTFSEGLYDIIFLDIYMDGMTGMETARKIRELDRACRLIFTTATADFAVDSYEVDSSYYLVKPFGYDKLCRALERCGAALMEQEQWIAVPGQAGGQRLFPGRIAYTEYGSRRVLVHYQDGETLSIPMSQGAFAALLLKYPYFCDCMKGILVSFKAVDKLLEDHFLLKSGEKIPISRLKYREVREQFLEFSYAHVRGEN